MRAVRRRSEWGLAVLGIVSLFLFALLAACNGDPSGPPRVASVVVTAAGGKTQLLLGERVQLTATARDRDGTIITGRGIVFASSNEAVASVAPATGLVTAVGPGSARITARVDDVSGFVDLGITVVPVAQVVVTPGALALHPRWTEPLTVVLKDAGGAVLADRAIEFFSTDQNIATVSPAGVVTAHGIGKATIIVSSEGKSADIALDVTDAPVATVSILPGSANIPDGLDMQFTAALADARGFNLSRVVTWTSTNESVATVLPNGRAFGVAPGATDITATSEGKSATVPLVVRSRVATIVVTPGDATMRTGEDLQLSVALFDKNGVALSGRLVTFTPFAGIIVTEQGLVRAIEVGAGKITVRSEGREAQVPLTVIERVMFMEVTPRLATLPVGSQTQIVVTLRDRTGQVLTGRLIDYSSANGAVASVSPTGLVTGVSPGVVILTVVSERVSQTVQITVP